MRCQGIALIADMQAALDTGYCNIEPAARELFVHNPFSVRRLRWALLQPGFTGERLQDDDDR